MARLTHLSRALTLASLVAIAAPPAHAEGPETFADAKAAAAEAGKPLLIDFYATWCGPCKAFTAASSTHEALKTKLASDVVLFKIDAEKGEGLDLADRFDVRGYPTFVLANAEGATIDRWMGYGGPEWFIEKMEAGLLDLSTVREKARTFSKEPTEALALTLARIAEAESSYGDAVAYYRRAEALNPGSSHAAEILDAMSGGVRTGLYTNADVLAQAQDVLAAPNVEPDALINTTLTVRSLAASDRDHVAAYVPFIERAMAVVDEASEELRAYAKKHLAIDHALYVTQDADRAIELKKATYADGWKDDATKLNSFAWWCFENAINLDEAEALARRAVELAPEGRERANVLDTLAEICNLKGDCGEAVSLIKQALAIDPDNEYLEKQLARFEDLLAKQS